MLDLIGRALLPISDNYEKYNASLKGLGWCAYNPAVKWSEGFWSKEELKIYHRVCKEECAQRLTFNYYHSNSMLQDLNYLKSQSSTDRVRQYMLKNMPEYLRERAEVVKKIRHNLDKERYRVKDNFFDCRDTLLNRKKIIRNVFDERLNAIGLKYDGYLSGKDKIMYSKQFPDKWFIAFGVHNDELSTKYKHSDGVLYTFNPCIFILNRNGEESFDVRLHFQDLLLINVYPFGNIYSHCWQIDDLYICAQFYCDVFDMVAEDLLGALSVLT